MKARRPTTKVSAPAPPAPAAPDDGALALKLFDRLFRGPSWAAWRAWVCGVFGLPMSEAEAAIFRDLTARSTLPTSASSEAWTIAGRRSGKSRLAAFVVAFLAAVRKWRVAPGERPMVLLIAPSRRQAGVVLAYAEAMLEALPGLRIIRRTTEEIEVSTGVTVRIESASFRTPRGFTVVGLVADEIAFWRDDAGANPDREILRAVKPALASVVGSLLVAISTPYSRRGSLHETHERHYGRDDSDVLVAQAPTRTLNPTISAKLVERAREEDPASAAAEWDAQFRSDLESLFAREALASVTVRERYELAPMPGLAYIGFLDPSGGSGRDSFTLAIAHRDVSGRAVLDLVREVKPPFSPEAVCLQFAHELKRYSVVATFSDSYAAQWPVEQFAKAGVMVQPSELTRSELYLELVPMVMSGACELLDDTRLLGQLSALERRTGASGRDSVDHRRGQHDDRANVCAGALVMATQALGLKASLPTTFDGCNRERSGLPALAGGCYLFHGSGIPPNDVICRNCPGHAYVRSAREAHQKRTGQAIDIAVYFREHCQLPEPLATRVALEWTRKWSDAMGI
jgi:hypothetical protein